MQRPQAQPPNREWLDGARARIQRVMAQPEPPVEHCRNALTILRFTIEHDEPILGNGCPAVAVPITSLARIQARLEAAIEQLEPEKDEPDYRHPIAEVCCMRCHGTILPPTSGGVRRGTCHCDAAQLDRFFSEDR